VVRLRELDWIEGRTIAIESRWTEGRPERLAEIAAEFVRHKVNIIVTNGTSVATLKQATQSSLSFLCALDPVGGGLVRSLAQPGRNVTGLSLQQSDAAGKWLEFLRAAVPRLQRLAIMVNAGYPSARVG
jgi:putative ABC transport system substrate-binding protein